MRVIVSRRATPKATSPAIWAVSTGARGEESDTEAALARRLPWLCPAADDDDGLLPAADGEIAGNSPEALLAPMSELETPFRLGKGPSGSTVPVAEPVDDALGEAEAEAAVTETASVTDGAVHFAVVTTLAVAVSFTELTEVAPDATGI